MPLLLPAVMRPDGEMAMPTSIIENPCRVDLYDQPTSSLGFVHQACLGRVFCDVVYRASDGPTGATDRAASENLLVPSGPCHSAFAPHYAVSR